MAHPSALFWSYVILAGGILIVLFGLAAAFRAARESSRSSGDLLLRKRMEVLKGKMQAGENTREEYNRRRTEILVERYKQQAS